MIHYLNEQGVLSRQCMHTIDTNLLRHMYRIMSLTRHIDERMIVLQRQGLITFALSSLGEEACAVASAAALTPKDWLYPQYREVGALFWRGFSPLNYVHQMFGNSEDLILGRQMPNHFGDRSCNVVTVSSPIATNIPHAAGCAYAMKLQKEEAVVLCYFGEGATSEGDFHVGINFAAVRRCPVIFLCRNNGYAISTPFHKQCAATSIGCKGIGYGVQAFEIDGNDVFAIHETVTKAKALCLKGEGPILIEAFTYRMGAHSTSDDPTQYRQEKQVRAWADKCPLLRLRRYLEAHQLWNEKEQTQLSEEIREQVSQAIAIAKETPPPKPQTLIEHVYHQVPTTLKEQWKDAQYDNGTSA